MHIPSTKNYHSFFFVLILLIFFLSGCYAPRYTQLEILFPADSDLPDNIEKVTMVNRSYLPLDERQKTGVYYTRNHYERSETYLDSIVSDNALHSLAEHLNNTPRLEVDEDYTISRMNVTDYSFLDRMKREKVSKLCNEKNADAVVALEAFHSFDSLYYVLAGFDIIGIRSTRLKTVWSTYSPASSEPLDKFYLRDTTWFQSRSNSGYTALRKLPSRKEALQEASYQAGKKYAKIISPYWKEIERLYFAHFSETMNKATEHARNENWKEAAIIWRRIAENGDKRKHALAAFNMAVVSEIKGNLELASYWLDKALEKKSNIYEFKKYRKTLEERIKRQKTIDRQMGLID